MMRGKGNLWLLAILVCNVMRMHGQELAEPKTQADIDAFHNEQQRKLRDARAMREKHIRRAPQWKWDGHIYTSLPPYELWELQKITTKPLGKSSKNAFVHIKHIDVKNGVRLVLEMNLPYVHMLEFKQVSANKRSAQVLLRFDESAVYEGEIIHLVKSKRFFLANNLFHQQNEEEQEAPVYGEKREIIKVDHLLRNAHEMIIAFPTPWAVYYTKMNTPFSHSRTHLKQANRVLFSLLENMIAAYPPAP